MTASFVILGWSLFIASGCIEAKSQERLDVHCAASIADATREAADEFSQRSGQKVAIHTGASSTLASQILKGSQADVFISANRQWLNSLEKEELVADSTIREIATNRIVLAARRDASFTWDPDTPLSSAFSGRLAIGNPSHVPSGIYAKEALNELNQWGAFGDRIVTAQDASATIAYLLDGHATAAIIYASDLQRSDAIAEVHRFDMPKPRLWAAPIRGQKGDEFMMFLSSDAAQTIFKKHGLMPPSGEDAPIPLAENSQGAIEEIVILSVRVSLVAVLLILPFGIFFGWLLARREFPGKSILNALIHVPLVLPPVVTGYMLLWCFGRHGPLGWLGFAFTWEGAAIASAIVAFPLFVRAARIGFESIDPRLEDAAQTLGASPSRVFFRISLPLCSGALISGALLAFGRSLGEFGATITFAGSVAGETETLPLAIHTALQSPTGDETVATLALVSTLLAFGTLLIGEWLARRVRWTK